MDIKQVLWPGWETTRLIGRGSFGAVYEIQRKLFEDDEETEKAALKVISIPQNDSDIEEMYNDGYDEESVTSTFHTHLKSIVAEYSLMRKMNGSSNIVNCDDVRYVQHDDGIGWDIYIKMELLTPLAKALPATVSEVQVIKIAKDMCAALELCSKHNIVHRDIKPQNIFVSENGDYKLGDFGIAKTVEKTMGGTKTGTYKYMAPEVYNNKPYNCTADIYSLGLVLYWLLNERRMPFMPLPPEKLRAGMDEESRNRRFSGEKIPAPKNGSEELKRIVLKACVFDPKDRYQSAQEMREDLMRLSGGDALIQNTQDSAYVAEQEAGYTDATVGPAFGHASQNGQFDATEKTVGPVFCTKVNKDSFEEEKIVGPVFAEQKKQKSEKKRRKIWPAIVAAACIVIAVLVVVFGMGKRTHENVLMADIYDTSVETGNYVFDSAHELVSAPSVFGSSIKRNQIRSITILDSIKNAPKSSWDVSEAQNGSVLAWVFPNAELYDLYIASDGGIIAPENCSTLFAGYAQVREMDLRGIDTSSVTDMSDMFYSCCSLERLDVSGFDTSLVMDMGNMFGGCISLETLDVSSFDTSSVTNMASMFAACSNLESLDLRCFDTSSVGSMAVMFWGCNSLETVDLNGFDTSNVVDMGQMFSGCSNLKTLDLSSFDTSAASYLNLMFEGCDNLEAPDVSHFDISNASEFEGFSVIDGKVCYLQTTPEKENNVDGDLARYRLNAGIVSTGGPNVVLLRNDGTVIAAGRNDAGQCNVDSWTDIIAISSSCFHTVGLKSDGTVVATGSNSNYQCEVNTWTDIIQIAAGGCHTVGLKSDGTVVAAGNTDGSQWDLGQCDVSDWTDIVYIAASDYYTIGVKSDGTIVETGSSDTCGGKEGWNNIVSVTCDSYRVVGLKADGTVVSFKRALYSDCDYSSWTDIVAIAAGYYHTVGLRADGTVVAAGITSENAKDHGCTYYGQCDVEDWSEIIAIAAGINTTVGVRKDGTVLVIGEDADSMDEVYNWQR